MTAERPSEVDAEWMRRLIGAWDCCGTCAGGMVARLLAQVRAERDQVWREAVERLADELAGQGRVPDILRSLAPGLGDAAGGGA